MTAAGARLRTFTAIDRLAPQVAGFLGTVCRGDPPLPGDAAVLVEVAPAMAVERALDVALKATRCVPGLVVTEREFGLVELHHRDQGEVRDAGARILDAFGLREEDRAIPRLVTRERITGTDPQHAQLINRLRHGDLLAAGDTLLLLEVEPAGYALLAANEAEKAARISVLEVLAFGAFGRVWLGGDDASVQVAARAAMAALEPT